MPPSKQLFLEGAKVHCIHKKTLKNCYVVEYKYSKYYVLNYKDDLFYIHRDKVDPGWIDWKTPTQTSSYLASAYPGESIEQLVFR